MSNLCLVSRRLNDLACPLLLSRINLGGFSSRLRDRSTQLKALSNGDTKASALAKHLSIDYSSSFSDDPSKVLTPLEKTMIKYIKPVIDSFRGITTMSWQIGQYEPLWLIDSIIHSLAAIPTLKDINLNYLYSSSTRYPIRLGNLRAFSNLHKIRARTPQLVFEFTFDALVIVELGELLAQCPALTDLDICMTTNMSHLFRFVDQAGKSLSLQHLSMKEVVVSPDYFKSAAQHLRSLKSFCFYRRRPTHVWFEAEPSIWDMLIQERIYIRNIATDAVNNSLLHYLSSFQGLQSFSGMLANHQLPVNILQAMIPHHAESLAELNILVDSNHDMSDWSPPFPENVVDLLSSFNNLRCFTLQLFVTTDYVPIMKHSFPTCAKIFPKLERLVLHTPPMSFYPLHPHKEFHLPFTPGIHDAIANYRSDDPSIPSFEIDCERLTYKPREDGTFSYVA